MENKITIEECCAYYNVQASFIQQLDEHGLIELSRTEKAVFIDYGQLAGLEKYMHMHYELEINMEGMEAVTHLLYRVEQLQQKIKRLEGELPNR